jgi:hypothetical protein
MRISTGPALLAVALLGAVGLALFQRPSAARTSAPMPSPVAAAEPPSELDPPSDVLPPNHPPIPASRVEGAVVPTSEAPALRWDVPSGWEVVPSKSAMRLATYRVASTKQGASAVELTVTRAGGTTSANLERWVGQFDGAGHDLRTERRENGLLVTTLEVDGTYEGGMTMGGTEVAHPGWSLLGAVVETSAPYYFFKLVGPIDAVRAAKPAFGTLLASLRKTS